MSDSDWGGPYIQAAGFCDQVIESKDGVLSLIRLVDRFTIAEPGLAAESRALPSIQTTMVIMIKSGSAKGSRPVNIIRENPSGTIDSESRIEISILLEGEERGTNLVIPMAFAPESEGLHWFTVAIGDRTLTRMPLRVIVQGPHVEPGRSPGGHE